MKKLTFVLLALCLLGALPLAAEDPIGLDVGLEIDTGSFPSTDPFALTAIPSIGYTVGKTGFALGAELTIPLLPSFSMESLLVYETYDFAAGDFSFTIENDNDIYFGDEVTFDGLLEVVAAWNILSLGVDFSYYPDFLIDTWLAADWSAELGPGTFGLGTTFNFPIYTKPGIGDIEPYVSYELPVGPAALTFEVDGCITGIGTEDFGASASALVAVGFSL